MYDCNLQIDMSSILTLLRYLLRAKAPLEIAPLYFSQTWTEDKLEFSKAYNFLIFHPIEVYVL